MHKQYMFSMLLFFISFCIPENLHGMHLSKTTRTLLHKQRLVSPVHKLYITSNANTHTTQKEGEIFFYDSKRDKDSVARIAIEHMFSLTNVMPSDQSEKEYQAKWDNEILPKLDYDRATSKVYRVNDKTVGFINYTIHEPWPLGRDATVHHLAIDSEHHGKGYGRALLSDALCDCQNQSVSMVTLFTRWVDYKKLDHFYRSFGFDFIGGSKYTGTDQWIKRLKPHPVVVLAHLLRDWLYTFRNK